MTLRRDTIAGIRTCIWEPEESAPPGWHPVILFTHGAGSRGEDLSAIEAHPVIAAIRSRAEGAIIVAPHCETNSWFDVFGDLLTLVRTVSGLPGADPDRVYGIGVSMGGYAMVQLMECLPEVFAAGMICCGGGMYWNADRLCRIPLRLIHGAPDTTVYPEESRRLYERVTACGGDATLTVYPDCDHNCWSRAFEDSENSAWLLKKERAK